MSDKKASEVLDCAADLIEEKGLAKGTYWSAVTGAYCTYGAVGLCDEGVAGFSPRGNAILRTYFRPLIPPSFQARSGDIIMAYNDAKRTTARTIVAKLRKAAKIAREAGD